MNCKVVTDIIVNWMVSYCEKCNHKGFVIGISGGVDSALVSTLCAMTGKEIVVISIPIHQVEYQMSLGDKHIAWLHKNFNCVSSTQVNLTDTFEKLRNEINDVKNDELAMANTRSRLRMLTLYAYANNRKLLVAGTGNKVEDYGIGFFTKGGDGLVDISPIGDLSKSQVWELAAFLGIDNEIVKAKPTDGLWADNRGDEDAIGATYPELEWAIAYCETADFKVFCDSDDGSLCISSNTLTPREKEVLKIYLKRHNSNQHKMNPIPICKIPQIIL